jgi:hypothetical protein
MFFFKFLFIAIFIFDASSFVVAQTHFKFPSNTGNNATLAVPSIAAPNILGTPLANGDEIAVFTPDGLCAGATVWQPNQNAVIVIWGDNERTTAVDGLRAGEQMQFCVWQKSTNTGIGDVAVSYSSGTGTFAANGIYVLASLTAHAPVVPLPPTLSLPAGGTTDITSAPRLSWFTSCSAASYRLQVSTISDFSTLVLDQDGVDSLFYDFAGVVSHTTYYWRVAAVNSLGTSGWSASRSFATGTITGVEGESPALPRELSMEQNYPNPMNPSTKIHFNLPIATRIALTIFNTLGQEIRTLVDAPRAAGKHILQWDGKDNDGKPAASGVYLYRLQAGSFSQTKRLTLLR